MNFKVAEYADEVDEAYILKALKFGYQGRTYTDKFSDKLVKVLLSDYKRKMKNLEWFLKDEETGRIRNYITLDSSAKELLANAIRDNQTVKDITDILKTMGATYTPEEFLKNKCTYKKQTVKISNIITERDNTQPYDMDIYNAGGSDVYVHGTRFKSYSVYLTAQPDGFVLYTDSTRALVKGFIHKSVITFKRQDNLSTYSKGDIEAVIQNVMAASLVISMDLADIITCSTGSCRSCLSVDNYHSAGAIQSFRTEFSLIMFTAGADRFTKIGRSWLYLRATEKGFPRALPFWKQQKSYGTVTTTHQSLVTELIKTKIKTIHPNIDFRQLDMGWDKYVVSPNVSTSASGTGHTAAPGYIDSDCAGYKDFYVDRSRRDSYTYSREMLLPFLDMLNLDGEVSNITSFHVDRNHNKYFGGMYPNTYEVTCAATGTKVLDIDAVEIDGVWYRKDILSQLITGKDIKLEETEVAPEPDEEAYEDVELDEDF